VAVQEHHFVCDILSKGGDIGNQEHVLLCPRDRRKIDAETEFIHLREAIPVPALVRLGQKLYFPSLQRPAFAVGGSGLELEELNTHRADDHEPRIAQFVTSLEQDFDSVRLVAIREALDARKGGDDLDSTGHGQGDRIMPRVEIAAAEGGQTACTPQPDDRQTPPKVAVTAQRSDFPSVPDRSMQSAVR